MDDDTQLVAAVSAAIAAALAAEQPPWLHSFEQAVHRLTNEEEASDEEWEIFRTGIRRCRAIVEGIGFAKPSIERTMIVAVFAAQGLRSARSFDAEAHFAGSDASAVGGRGKREPASPTSPRQGRSTSKRSQRTLPSEV